MSLSDLHNWPDTPSASDIELLCTARSEAAQALGILQGLLSTLPAEALSFFTARLIRITLMAALRQEGHKFTDARFFSWFAGLTTLSEEALSNTGEARAVVTALLSELSHCTWEPLAECANNFSGAFSAFGDLDDGQTHLKIRAQLDEARRLLDTLSPAPLPFSALAAMHHKIGQSVAFAPIERATDELRIDNLVLVIERSRPPAPRWPIEILIGAHLHRSGTLPVALPMTGLIRHDAIQTADDDRSPMGIAALQAEALRDSLTSIIQFAKQARRSLLDREQQLRDQRSNSRSPLLWALLDGFGPMRSSQIEHLLGATRLGVRAMLTAIEKPGMLEKQTINGVKLHALRPAPQTSTPQSVPDYHDTFSQDALDDYEASMAHVDALLSRYTTT